MVYALGGTTLMNFLKAIKIAFDVYVPVLKEGYETSVVGLYRVPTALISARFKTRLEPTAVLQY